MQRKLIPCNKCGKLCAGYKVGCCRKCFVTGVGRDMLIERWATKGFREKMSDNRRGVGNPNWRGDIVGYAGLHVWINRVFPKPDVCDECKTESPLDLANKGVYDRNIENWEWLCRRCHMTKDGRLKRFVVAGIPYRGRKSSPKPVSLVKPLSTGT